jgi:hypothetical protein
MNDTKTSTPSAETISCKSSWTSWGSLGDPVNKLLSDASRKLLRTLKCAFREALLALPVEEYGWFRYSGSVFAANARFFGGSNLLQYGPLFSVEEKASDTPVEALFRVLRIWPPTLMAFDLWIGQCFV